MYKKHSRVAVKRLRIAGKFVTKERAFKILGIEPEELLDNVMIQELLNKHDQELSRLTV